VALVRAERLNVHFSSAASMTSTNIYTYLCACPSIHP
jgi:hypothetical protein